ncbi:ABC-type spermidine/putrescine transport system permease subunit I [Frondihabitans australicus]|uniref:ABC-type spermidine/putrescine transport system permease subunit I n=2 Tax=Frondihabitans australicus TaxID=386892 RepID=A0A495IDY1_9MICO|nr:ABC-type spermidine/putrescine transport system permease subunit I [Frondihabitans australicus]
MATDQVAGAGPAPTGQTRRPVGRRGVRAAPYLLSLAGSAWLLILFVIPLVSGLIVSLMSGNPEKGFTFTWDWGVYSSIFVNPAVPYATFFVRSLVYGGAATLITIIVGYPMAYFIAFRVSPRWKNALLFLVLLSFLVSFVIRIDMWAFILADQGPLLTILRDLHLASKDFHILGTSAAVIGGDAYNDLAFMVLPIYVALEKIEPRFLEAAGDLYGSPRTVFSRVVLPLSRSGIFAGVLLVFIDTVGDPVDASLLGGTNTYTIGQAIQDAYLTNQQYNVAAALSTVLMILLGIILFVYARIAGTENIENLV